MHWAEANLPPFVDTNLIRQMYSTTPVELKSLGGGKESLYVPLPGHAGLHGVLVIAPGFFLTQSDPEESRFFETFIGQIAQGLERVRLSEQANESSLQVESEALRNSLLSAISHDLRTPLTRILGAASALAEHDDTMSTSARHEFTAAIQNEAQHMADLMSKILEMARLTSGKIVLHREWNVIEEILGGALARLDTALQGREVILRIPDTLPLVKVDAVLLQQVLINLIDNAIKYTPSATPIEIFAELEPEILRLTVADRGPGIPQDQRDRLFEKFHRLNPESPQTGVGLGLALCRSIMEAHDGGITVKPRASGGSLFELRLPIDDQPLLKELAESSEKSHD